MAFQLKSNKKESENKTIRFPLPLVEQIDKAIENQDVTFSNFVIQACEYALENMEIPEDSMSYFCITWQNTKCLLWHLRRRHFVLIIRVLYDFHLSLVFLPFAYSL